jgi:hypothetical protein
MNNKTRDGFYLFKEYLTQETEQLQEELLEAFRAGELGCPHCFALELVDHYKTQFMSEVFKLTKDNPVPAAACLVQKKMLLEAESVLVEELMKQLEELHPELL